MTNRIHSIMTTKSPPSVFALLVLSGLLACIPGSTIIAAPAPSVKDLRLSVSKNGRHLVDQNGKPFFYLGDTCWLLFQRLNRDEVDEYLKDRADKGFTVIQAYVLRGLGEGDNREDISGRNRAGETALVNRDPTRLNEAFFQNVDWVINRANELGLVMALVTSKSWHVNEHPERVFNTENAYTFGKLLAERYHDNAVLWYVGGDSPPGNDAGVWEAMARGHKDGSGGRHLVSYHGQGSTSSSMWFHTADWLDFNSIQSGHNYGSDSYKFVSHDYALAPTKPTLDMEPAYENHPTGAGKPRVDSHKVRSQAYVAMFAGAAGHGYGALDLFHLYGEDQGPFPRDGFQPWRKAIAYEGSNQVGLMRRLLEPRAWHTMVPDQSLLAAGHSDGVYRTQAARAADGSFVMVYLPSGRPLSIHMGKLSGAKVKARWFNPRDGSWDDIGEFPNAGVRAFTAPSEGPKDDWVLVLDAGN